MEVMVVVSQQETSLNFLHLPRHAQLGWSIESQGQRVSATGAQLGDNQVR